MGRLYNIYFGAELALNIIARHGEKLVAEAFAASGHQLTHAGVHGSEQTKKKQSWLSKLAIYDVTQFESVPTVGM